MNPEERWMLLLLQSEHPETFQAMQAEAQRQMGIAQVVPPQDSEDRHSVAEAPWPDAPPVEQQVEIRSVGRDQDGRMVQELRVLEPADERTDFLHWLDSEPWAQAYLELFEPGSLEKLRQGRQLARGQSRTLKNQLVALKDQRVDPQDVPQPLPDWWPGADQG